MKISAIAINAGLFLLSSLLVNVPAMGESEGIAQLEHVRRLPNGVPFRNATGFASTVSTTGSIDLTNEFFQDLGANGRRCVTCHLPNAGWTIIPSQVQEIFRRTRGGATTDALGLGAIFRTNDGSNSPLADVSTVAARRKAYSMLLTKGLIRVGIGVPANADFELVSVDDPYGFASAAELSLFRRPLPTTNLRFLTTVMWDGRETFDGSNQCNVAAEGGKCFAAIHFNLAHQANGATEGHAQSQNSLSDAQRESIVAFEASLATAQVWDHRAKGLHAAGATGGPEAIFPQTFYYGINDNLGDYQTHAPFDAKVFNIFDAWTDRLGGAINAMRRSIARGQAIFNSKTFTISGVAGLNVDSPFSPPLPQSFDGTCSTCHNTPNSGNHSIVAPLDIGVSDASRRTPDMPLYVLQQKCVTLGDGSRVVARGCPTKSVTDPGRALISGSFADIGKFKGPILRGLAARAPYFHNGSAADLAAVVDFYNERFGAAIVGQDREDLIAFLGAL
jgi:cytochrome c peroxidase